jgi:iron complex outermembrane recepter protein
MKKFNLLFVFLLLTVCIYAQKKQYTITVNDAVTGKSVANASVKVRGNAQGANANDNGVATLQANAGDVIDVSSVGYNFTNVTLSSTTSITVLLTPTAADLGDIVVVGTRGAARAKTETAVPIDVIKINQVGLPSSRMDLTSNLNIAAPSFNYNKQSGADGADNIDLGTLRGLGPDQTLVLINGKRRHTTAFVALFGTRGRGASGTDLNGFTQSAVDRIEILRDGASAQYGSDAMAGVMNIVLNRNVNKWNVNVGWSGYYDDKFNARNFNEGNQYYSAGKIDGKTFNLSANNGFNIGNNGGFMNLSFDYRKQGKTFRQVDTTNWQNEKYALPYINSGRRAFGDGSIETYGFMYNMELPIKNTKTKFYSFGGVNTKEAEAFAYTRNVDDAGNGRPDRFPVTAPGGSVIVVPQIMRRTNDGITYYNPIIATFVNDGSLAMGFKGVTAKNWNWDASLTTGKNNFQYQGRQTFNASLIGNTTKNIFDDGGFSFRQSTLNIDLSKSFKTVAQGLNVGYGFEYRNENYKINKGEEASYENYDNTGTQGSGAQGFPGFGPADVVNAKRSSLSAYVDGELNVTDKWLVNAAARFENYSDFGSVVTYKLATRYKVTDNFNLRASASTGFRAPSLQQINFSNTLTSFSNGVLVESRIARNGDAVSRAAGIPDLKQETSQSASLGFAYKPIQGLTITIDGYATKVKDRVVLSGLFSADDATLPTAFTDLLKDLDVATAQFFANAVNTTNYGLDVVVDYNKKWSNKTFRVLFAGNVQSVKLDKINVPFALSGTVLNQKTFFSDREIAFLKASAPNAKFNLNLNYSIGKFNIGANLTYFGNVKLTGFGTPTAENPNYGGINPQVTNDATGALIPEIYNYKGRLVTDINMSYKLCKSVTLFVGADNILNVHPELGVAQGAKANATGNESGGPWESVQMGFNGRRLFTKLAINF